ncbi:hypothetical protein PF002_g28786 [Phytophthora fragariae]|uniref:Uncharacterized protein n=1 Tax=Phytophthora fragariae TaxID=53985 RepID=A0A6A3W8Y2_9STRA|nr:hypothetical protein PF009_g28736 [Phytophthora fragariae]KAE8968402.1 hypothetical protein PF011_g27196 [Phytophthora fragariae]KAE9067223.1 hypothetical protein PF007_g28153 [Phytophthora fragariae]KAE9078377.1 hypothetical protein PF006_g27733 [Phytophthora fragariae]KAE9175456.1 hypothetical protein PF002_g28786 [Phytophthora fragariae]
MLSRRRLTSTDVEAKRRGIDVRTLDVDSSNTNRTIATLRLQHQTGGAILWQSAAKERIKQDGNAHGRGMVLGLFRASIRA